MRSCFSCANLQCWEERCVLPMRDCAEQMKGCLDAPALVPGISAARAKGQSTGPDWLLNQPHMHSRRRGPPRSAFPGKHSLLYTGTHLVALQRPMATLQHSPKPCVSVYCLAEVTWAL